MKKMVARRFEGYGSLALEEGPTRIVASGKALVRVKAAGVSPLEHTVLSGHLPRARAPLVLGNEGAGVLEDAGASGLAVGSRVAFCGSYGVVVDGSWGEYVLVDVEDLLVVPDAVEDTVAAVMPVAYLTARLALDDAGFAPGKAVFSPAIGGSVGNATYQLARALGAGVVISTAGSAAKAAEAERRGHGNVIDLAHESVRDGLARITGGKGADVVVESLGGTFFSESLHALAPRGRLVTLGYSVSRQSTIDVTDLIWRRAHVSGFSLLGQPGARKRAAWREILAFVERGAIVPAVDRTYPLAQAGEALRHVLEDRPFGKVALDLRS